MLQYSMNPHYSSNKYRKLRGIVSHVIERVTFIDYKQLTYFLTYLHRWVTSIDYKRDEEKDSKSLCLINSLVENYLITFPLLHNGKYYVKINNK